MKLDQETSQALRDGQKLSDLVKDEKWQMAKGILTQLILDNNNIMNYQAVDPQKLFMEIAANQQAVKIVQEWIAQVEGRAEQHKMQAQAMLDQNQDSYIKQI